MVIPFGATANWIEAFLGGKVPEVSWKERARCTISGNITLTVPVEGGAKMLKNKTVNPMLSEHGKWRREHLGAWQAVYGRTPYYEHLMPEIEAVYADSKGITLGEFNARLLEVAQRWITPCNKTLKIKEEIRQEVRARINPELSIFDAIFRLGKETGLMIN